MKSTSQTPSPNKTPASTIFLQIHILQYIDEELMQFLFLFACRIKNFSNQGYWSSCYLHPSTHIEFRPHTTIDLCIILFIKCSWKSWLAMQACTWSAAHTPAAYSGLYTFTTQRDLSAKPRRLSAGIGPPEIDLFFDPSGNQILSLSQWLWILQINLSG